MPKVLDVLRRLRLSRAPRECYQEFNNYGVAVGLNLVSLSPIGHLPCSLVIIQASNVNGGIVCIGGPQTTLATGLELTGGQAVLFAASSMTMMQQKQLMGALGVGLLPYAATAIDLQDYMSQYSKGFDPAMPRIVIDIARLFAIANLAGQTVRIVYTIEAQL